MERSFLRDVALCGAKAILSHASLSRFKEPARYFTVQFGFGIASFAAIVVSVGSEFLWPSVLAGFWQTAISANKMTQRIVRGARVSRLMESSPCRRRPLAERDSSGTLRVADGKQAERSEMCAPHRENRGSMRLRVGRKTVQYPETLSSSTGMSAHRTEHVHGWIRMKHRLSRHPVRLGSWPPLPESLPGVVPTAHVPPPPGFGRIGELRWMRCRDPSHWKSFPSDKTVETNSVRRSHFRCEGRKFQPWGPAIDLPSPTGDRQRLFVGQFQPT